MLSLLVRILPLTLALAAPLASASAVTAVWPSELTPLPLNGGSASTPNLDSWSGHGQERSHPLPAGFVFYFGGVPYENVNIGGKGYVTFGGDLSTTSAASGRADRLRQEGAPEQLIAAWWGDHYCDEEGGELLTQAVGEAPNRWYVIQWRCSRYGQVQTPKTQNTFEAQLWLLEGSDVARVKYGQARIEAGWDWDTVSWGIKVGAGPGFVGPNRSGTIESCRPEGASGSIPKCRANVHFPTETTIQYGVLPSLDLTAAVDWKNFSLNPATLSFQASTKLRNLSEIDATGVSFDLYLSQFKRLREDGIGARRVYRHLVQEPVPARATTEVLDTVQVVGQEYGRFWVCAHLDPGGLLDEFDHENNRVCSLEPILVGPDLVATIEAPEVGIAGSVVQVPIRIRNQGNLDASPFDYEVIMVPDPVPGLGTLRPETVARGRLGTGLEAGRQYVEELDVALPQVLRGDRYRFIIRLDPEQEIDEADRTNNEGSSLGKMENKKAEVRVVEESVRWDLEYGCFFGEPVSVQFEICNVGPVEALGFQPAVAFGGLPLNLFNDAISSASPQSCEDGSPCAPVGGHETSCIEGSCRLGCTTDAECGAGMACRQDLFLPGEPWLCSNRLAPAPSPDEPMCRTMSLSGTIPLEDRRGYPNKQGTKRLYLIDDLTGRTSQAGGASLVSEERDCDEALPDFEAVSLIVPGRAAAGKEITVTRTLANVAFIERQEGSAPTNVEVEYRYYLSSSPWMSTSQIPLELRSQPGSGWAILGRMDEETRTEQVLLPAELLPGRYYLGLIVDPGGSVREYSKANNVFVASSPIDIGASGLEIHTSSLPTAIVGAGYRHSLVGIGGSGTLRWASTELPPGLTLSEGGDLIGTPEEKGLFSFVVTLSSGGHRTRRLLMLQVLEGGTPLSISTSALPAAVRGAGYGGWIDELGRLHEGFDLVASGGVPPYRWSLDEDAGGHLPEGLVGPSAQGRISGGATLRSSPSGFTVVVEDSRGSKASRELSIQVISGADLRLASVRLPEGRAGQPYRGCVEAAGGDSERGVQWEPEEGAAPAGLEWELGERACLHGVPTSCGNYELIVAVGDGAGMRVMDSVLLAIDCNLLKAPDRVLVPLERGEEVSLDLSSAALRGASWRLVQGSVPPGLELGADGRLHGKVAEDAPLRTYGFIAESISPEGRKGWTGLTVQVVEAAAPWEELPTTKSPPDGCSAGGGSGSSLWTLAILAVAFVVRGSRRVRLAPGGRRWLVGAPLLSLLLLVMAGCGGSDASDPLDRCALVSCDAPLSCDPSDGSCRCGKQERLLCAEGEVCSLLPTPQCLSSRCDLVLCERGMQCDVETGDCVCGVSTCDEGQRCVDHRCESIDRCDGVSCGLGERCDPADGSCWCGDERCEDEESCEAGSCVFDRCAGVSCDRNSVCSQESGRCHCGGPEGLRCQADEHCVEEPEGFTCSAADRCAQVSCQAGTACDPTDGSCRCGDGTAPGGVVCEEEQSCVDGQCVGGDLCMESGRPKDCGAEGAGSSCDPADGLCKCGGVGGERCKEEEICSDLTGVFRCTAACELFSSAVTCPDGEACYPSVSFGGGPSRQVCEPTGPGSIGNSCAKSSDCREGLYCSSAHRCRKLCDRSLGSQEGCRELGPNWICVALEGQERVGSCLEN